MSERDPRLGSDPAGMGAGPAGIKIARVFDAPRALVWREWTEPERFADWFGGSEAEVPLASVSMDLRPGGTWSATTLANGPQRRDIRWSGEYLMVIAPMRLAFTIRGLPGRHAPELVTVVLDDLGDARTGMLFQQHCRLTDAEYEFAETRWSAEFDRIAQRLTGSHGPHGPWH